MDIYYVVLLLLCLIGYNVHSIKGFQVSLGKSLEERTQLFHRRIIEGLEFKTINVVTGFKSRVRRQLNRQAQPDFQFVHFNIEGQTYSMKLTWRKRSVYSFTNPVWLLTLDSGRESNYTYKFVNRQKTYFEGDYYESKSTLTTLLAHYDKIQQRILYDGIFGLGTETHVIRAVPEMWLTLSNLTKNDNFILSSEERNEHVIYKARNYAKKCRSSFLTFEDSDANEIVETSIDKLYIKILPFIDYELYKLMGENIEETIKYVTTFWNAVDLRFTELYPSKIDISLTGIVIVTNESALSFVNEIRDKMNVIKVNPYQLLEEARMFFYENFIKDTNFTNYDTIFIMTALDTKPTAGMSYIGRICNRLYSTAFIQDDANYLGLHSATHELGHLVNLVHDGSDDAKDCSPYENNNNRSTIMAPIIVKSQSITWSECSKESLQKFIKTKAAKCLREAHRSK